MLWDREGELSAIAEAIAESSRGEGGVVVMRHGENAMNVIGAVKQRLAQIAPSLPTADPNRPGTR